jgi:hypothetical protein
MKKLKIRDSSIEIKLAMLRNSGVLNPSLSMSKNIKTTLKKAAIAPPMRNLTILEPSSLFSMTIN